MTAITTYQNHVPPIMKTSLACDPISSYSCPFKDLSIIRPHFSLLIQYEVWVSIHFPIDFVLWHDVFSLELSTRFHRKAHRILCMEEQIGVKWICWSHISYCNCIEWMCESRWLKHRQCLCWKLGGTMEILIHVNVCMVCSLKKPFETWYLELTENFWKYLQVHHAMLPWRLVIIAA